jgi:alginate O-acetyltransferase complex protein AlgI
MTAITALSELWNSSYALWLTLFHLLERYFQSISVVLPEPFFHTQAFLVFFAVVFMVYWSVPRRWSLVRLWILLIASFHFYAAWSRELALLVTATTCADYCFGRLLDATGRASLRRLWLLLSISMNLGLLCYFKYRGFFLNELHDWLSHWGYDPGYGKLDVASLLIPFGISFYTFEAISYIVDVYHRKIPAEKSLPRFLLFILFFPHLVSGPIVRAKDFLGQTRRPKRWNWLRVQLGVQLFLMGAFKKLAIADRMALFCDPVFQNPEAYRTTACWLAVLAYGLRIYCDFSGYSDMAVGLGHLFGYKLTANFNMPYLSANVAEFWRRWHISLSSWLRDYLFIPLGGSYGSRWRTYRNLMIVMTLGGLWHGAAWGYVLWGIAHGTLLIIHRMFREICQQRARWQQALSSPPGWLLRIAVTFITVNLCWVLFQPDLSRAWTMYQHLFVLQSGEPLPLHNRSLWYTALFVLACHLLVASGLWQLIYQRLPAAVLGSGYALCACLAMLLAPAQGTTFIYFQF